MADMNLTTMAEKEMGYAGSGGPDDSDSQAQQESQDIFERPKGFKGVYCHPLTQVSILGFICFLCPGLFNALNGLGGGGQLDTSTASNSNTAVYSTFAVCAFFAGSVNNKLGSRLTLLLGTAGYALNIGSYLALNIHPGAGGFVIGSGAVLGVCAGLLWTAQGSLMMAYPTEGQKGMFVGVFWAIFNLGGVVGSSVALGQNIDSKSNSVGNGTYISFLCITSVGVVLPLLMVNPENMIRSDGTKVTLPRHPSWKAEIMGLYYVLIDDPLILLLFPMFFASNWFTTWQFNDYNSALFNIRTRSLNNLLYWIAQIIGSLSIGFLLDQQGLSRRIRAYSGWTVLVVFVFFTHTWGYFYQKTYTRESITTNGKRMDIFDAHYPGKVTLYICFALLDAMWQTAAYWLMGSMSNDPAKLAHFAGFYKSLQSAGAAGVWRTDAVGLPYMNIFLSTWILLAGGLFFALPMIYFRVKDHTELEEETLARMDDTGHWKTLEEVNRWREAISRERWRDSEVVTREQWRHSI